MIIRNLENAIPRATELTPEVEAEIEAMFHYQEWNRTQIAAGILVRNALADAVRIIIANVPPGGDRSTAIRKLREARMDCNSAITFNGRY